MISSQLSASSSMFSSDRNLLSNYYHTHVNYVFRGLVLSAFADIWVSTAWSVHICKTWILTCPEAVQQRQCVTRNVKTWLPDSRFGYSSVVDHRTRQPVFPQYK